VAMRGAAIRIHHHIHNKKVSRRRSTGSSEWKDWLKPRAGVHVSEEEPLTWYCDDREQPEESIWSTSSTTSNTPSPDGALLTCNGTNKNISDSGVTFARNTQENGDLEGTFARKAQGNGDLEGTFARSGQENGDLEGTFAKNTEGNDDLKGTFTRSGQRNNVDRMIILEHSTICENQPVIDTANTNCQRLSITNISSEKESCAMDSVLVKKEIDAMDSVLAEKERTVLSLTPSLTSSESSSPTLPMLRLKETGSRSSSTSSSSSSNFGDFSFDEDTFSDLGPDMFGLCPDPGVIRFQFDDYPQAVLQSQYELNAFPQTQQDRDQCISSKLRSLHKQIGSLSVGNICLLEDSSYREDYLNFDSGFSESLSTGDIVNQNWELTTGFRKATNNDQHEDYQSLIDSGD